MNWDEFNKPTNCPDKVEGLGGSDMIVVTSATSIYNHDDLLELKEKLNFPVSRSLIDSLELEGNLGELITHLNTISPTWDLGKLDRYLQENSQEILEDLGVI